MKMLNFQARGPKRPGASSAMVREGTEGSVGIEQTICQFQTYQADHCEFLLRKLSIVEFHCGSHVRATVVWNMSEEPSACLAR